MSKTSDLFHWSLLINIGEMVVTHVVRTCDPTPFLYSYVAIKYVYTYISFFNFQYFLHKISRQLVLHFLANIAIAEISVVKMLGFDV